MHGIEKIKNSMCLQLFWAFFKLGLFTIGGGMAMIPLIQGVVVDQKKWMTEEEAVDCIAVSQGLPGVIAINMATYIGQKKRGALGAIFATVGVILPSFIIIILVVKLLGTVGDSSVVNGALKGIKAAATGLIAFSAYKVGKKVLTGVFQWILALAAFAAITFLAVNAVWTIIAGIACGLLYTYMNAHRESKRNGGESK